MSAARTTKVVTVEQMQTLERRSAELGVSVDALMENAGLQVARQTAALLNEVRGARVLVLVGPGNNGGDGLVAARHLHDWGARVALYVCTTRPGEPSKFQLCQARRIPVIEAAEDPGQETLAQQLASAQLVIDAVLGTGALRPLEATLKQVFQTLNTVKAHRRDLLLLALDLPTGMHADTGETDAVCPYADVTVTLGTPKVGLFAFPGAEHVGRLHIVDIGIPPGLDDNVDLELEDEHLAARLLPARPLGAHKGTFGRVLVVAGSRNFVGAAALACLGAYRSGAGLVTLATPDSVYRLVASRLMEVTHLPLPESAEGTVSVDAAQVVRQALDSVDVLLMGCGLGQDDATREFVAQVLLVEPPPRLPTLLDADALNNLAPLYRWWERLGTGAVLTPHPGEMVRLTGKDMAQVQADRLTMAREGAKWWNQVVVLKGAFTVIAAPRGRARLSPYANPSLASGGTGDVLSGVIAGLMAQGLSPFDAASCGVTLHALAGERQKQELGEAGLLAGDLLAEIPRVMKALREKGNAAGYPDTAS